MARIAIVGDGPAGLSAALFLAKNGHEATVYGTDDTAVHYAHLHNYLGVEDEPGPQFQARARDQVAKHGATLVDAKVAEVTADGDELAVRLDDDTTTTVDYVVLAAGKAGRSLAQEVGAEVDGGAVVVDREYRTGVDRVYAVGRLARPDRSQVVISAGAGAVAALDILAREAGEDVHDWDSLDE
jgi:thioredoxin reductase (NADPH)